MSNTRIVNGPGFRICYEDEPGFLRAYVFDGTDSLAVSSAMWQMLGAECDAAGMQRLLVVEDLLETVESADIETVIAAVEAAGFGARRTAFVELRDDIQGSEQGEIYCRERGIALRVFSNEGEARRWLLYDG